VAVGLREGVEHSVVVAERLSQLVGRGSEVRRRESDSPLLQAVMNELEEHTAGEHLRDEGAVQRPSAHALHSAALLAELLLDRLQVGLVAADGVQLLVEVALADADAVHLGRVGGDGPTRRAQEGACERGDEEEPSHDRSYATEVVSTGTISSRNCVRKSAGWAPRASGRTTWPISSL